MTFVGTPVVKINGVTVTVASLPAVKDAIGQRSQLSFVVTDTTGTLAIAEYQTVTITDAVGTPIFSGYVQDATFSRIAYAPVTYGWQVRCMDNVYLADKRIVAATYTNRTCGYIVNDMIAGYLAAEGVYAVRNMLSANQSDVETDTTGFIAANGATLTRDTTKHWHGAASLKVVTPGTVVNEGAEIDIPYTSLVPGMSYVFSVYALGSGTVSLHCREIGVVTLGGSANVTLNGSTFTRLSLAVTMPSSLSANIQFQIWTGGSAQAVTFWADGWQIEPDPLKLGVPQAWELGGTSTVQDGPTLTGWAIDYQTASSQIDKLSQLAGFYWNIDALRRLWFTAYNTTPSPFTFDGTQADDGTGNDLIAMQYVSPLYRNGQYVLGITETTSTQTETRKGDGTTTTFTFSYPLHAVPTVTVNAVSKTVGIKGVDSGKDWYWSKGDPTLSQDSAGTKLISTDTLQAVYVGEYKTLVYSQDDGQISMQQSLEGGTTTGKVQAVTTDTSLITSSQGFQVAGSLLAKYATSGKVLTFKTLTGGLAAGQLLTVNMPSAPWNLSNVQFLIESVEWYYDGFVWWASVKALDGPANDTWVNFFQRIAATVGTVDTGTSGVSQSVTLLQSVSETWTWTESVTPAVQACPVFPWTLPVTLC